MRAGKCVVLYGAYGKFAFRRGRRVAVQTIPVQVGETSLLVEVSQAAGSQQTSKLGDAVDRVGAAFADAQEAIVEVAASTAAMIEKVAKHAVAPQALEVEFGLKFSATGNVIVAGASGEATLQVKLVYGKPAV
jgi:hypothetical protein